MLVHSFLDCICKRMNLGQWHVSLDPVQQTVLTEIHIMQSNIVHNCSGRGVGNNSSTWMPAVIIATAQKHTFRFKERSIFSKRAVFANHLPRIGILNLNNDTTACMRGGMR